MEGEHGMPRDSARAAGLKEAGRRKVARPAGKRIAASANLRNSITRAALL